MRWIRLPLVTLTLALLATSLIACKNMNTSSAQQSGLLKPGCDACGGGGGGGGSM